MKSHFCSFRFETLCSWRLLEESVEKCQLSELDPSLLLRVLQFPLLRLFRSLILLSWVFLIYGVR